ncbi:hypothetical protein [Acetivibrio mesophilus]|uniref:Uncharacterized protein n=1 Tax=Acetivibrio mesophilus TaxID=2487273 RepID=A0A4Q0I6Q0_9FIRM|nr:hypothetical protein [Acetivibrio mesophilus]RXE59515.1 hypothetical protein EFD62_06060 [Acetivibrio mesophilus]
MQVRNRLNADLPLNKLMVYPVVTVLYMVFVVLVFFIPVGPAYNIRESLYFLIFPLEMFLVGLTAMHFVDYFFKGKWAQVLSRSCLILGNGISVFLFWFLVSSDIQLRLASCGIIPVTVSIILYRISGIYDNRLFKGEIIKTISYLVAGFSVFVMCYVLWPQGSSYLGFGFSLGKLTLYSFIVLSVFELASLIELCGNEKAYGIADWLRFNHVNKFIAIFITLFTIVDLRRIIMRGSILGAWIIIFVVILIAFIILTIKLLTAANNSREERLNKHLQKINFDKIKDISEITSYINDFVYNGSKSGLIACIFLMTSKTGVPIWTARRMIAPIVDHKDLEMPSFMTRKDYKVIEERNKQKRIKIIEYVIKNLEVYGRGNYNGFGTASNTMQRNN